MPTVVHGFDWPDRIVVGTIGPPGSRSFYLQARTGARVVSVSLEKEQSALLAEKINEILDALMTTDGNPSSVPAASPSKLMDNDPLDQPVEPEFRTGAIGLGWDPSTSQIVIEAYPLVDGETQESEDVESAPPTPEPAEMLVVRIPVGTARAFAARTIDVVNAGRG
jgi:uncharacterized repeat protein (TIGR03847 family)